MAASTKRRWSADAATSFPTCTTCRTAKEGEIGFLTRGAAVGGGTSISTRTAQKTIMGWAYAAEFTAALLAPPGWFSWFWFTYMHCHTLSPRGTGLRHKYAAVAMKNRPKAGRRLPQDRGHERYPEQDGYASVTPRSRDHVPPPCRGETRTAKAPTRTRRARNKSPPDIFKERTRETWQQDKWCLPSASIPSPSQSRAKRGRTTGFETVRLRLGPPAPWSPPGPPPSGNRSPDELTQGGG